MVSEKLQKRLYSNVSCVLEFYRVLKLSKINPDRTGALRLVHFGNFSGRAQPGSAAGRAGWQGLKIFRLENSFVFGIWRQKMIKKIFKELFPGSGSGWSKRGPFWTKMSPFGPQNDHLLSFRPLKNLHFRQVL